VLLWYASPGVEEGGVHQGFHVNRGGGGANQFILMYIYFPGEGGGGGAV
jgi:hypothetical protein